MNNPPNRCLVDTNVPKTANLSTSPDESSEIPRDCVNACVIAIEHVVNKGSLVIDDETKYLMNTGDNLPCKGNQA